LLPSIPCVLPPNSTSHLKSEAITAMWDKKWCSITYRRLFKSWSSILYSCLHAPVTSPHYCQTMWAAVQKNRQNNCYFVCYLSSS
jgi:hypothetical protein